MCDSTAAIMQDLNTPSMRITLNTIKSWVSKRMKTYADLCHLLRKQYGEIDGYEIIKAVADDMLKTGAIGSDRHAKVMRYINADGFDTDYLKVHNKLRNGERVAPIQSEEDTAMTQMNTVDTKHFVNGRDVATFSTSERIALIHKTEQELADLCKITSTSALVQAEIAKKQEFLDAIVEQFDAETKAASAGDSK